MAVTLNFLISVLSGIFIKFVLPCQEGLGEGPALKCTKLILIIKTYNYVDPFNVECDRQADGYRLPTDDEWEYAARGGLSGKRFPWGDTISHIQANYYAWYNNPAYPYDATASAGDFEGIQMGRLGSTRASSSDLPETIVERGETHALLARLIQGLPFQQRELLHLKVQGQLTYREIAEATGLTVANVGYHLHQAMLTLRAEMQRVERAG